MSDSKQPPIIINHNESGTFIIGEDKDDKQINKKNKSNNNKDQYKKND